jgi:hypothetical protein
METYGATARIFPGRGMNPGLCTLQDRPAPLKEGPQDQPDEALLPGGPPGRLPLEGIQGLEIVRRQDPEARHGHPPLSSAISL